MRVTSIATQGRPHSSEYTMEYTISYGTNGLDYAMYKEQGGYTKYFCTFCPTLFWTLALLTSGVGDSAWSPEENTYFQSIKADMGDRKIINWIVTKGRAFTSEWVTEYIVEYSDDGQQWKTVTDHSGNNEVFGY
uniref:F5/8 type C domain-containing protein n=1 Tax=Rhodnius prolixus TaxID=13249 RepID=T1IDW1_RHOPR